MSLLGAIGDGWAALALAVTWQLAALAAVAWVVERAFKLRQPRARHTLWWFVLVAPLVLAPGRMALERREAVVRVTTPAAVERAVALVRIPATSPVQNPMAGPAAAAAPVADTSWWTQVRPVSLAALLWALGCAALAARLLVGHMRVRRMLRESSAVENEQARAGLVELCGEAGIRGQVALRTSEAVGAPVLYGLRRPAVLLPADWLDSLAPDELQALLAHEVAHVKRHDFLANLIQRFVEILLFFHPGAWLASRRITLAREELADAWAATRVGDPSSYARSLTACAERAQARLAIASVGVVEGRSTLQKRVEAIMQGGSLKRMSRPWVVAIVALGLISAAAFSAVQLRGEAKPTVMPPIPSGIHLKYRVTTQEFALPQDVIEMRIAGMKRSSAAAEENMLREMKAGSLAYSSCPLPASLIDSSIASNRAFYEKRIHEVRGRTVDGPIRTSTVEYWGTVHGFMYATTEGSCVAYDGKKTALGSALHMVPDLIRQPTEKRSGMNIAWGTWLISDVHVPYLGIYQPGTELFGKGVVLSETVPLATGEKRVYRLPFERKAALEYDKEGRVRSLTVTVSNSKGTFVVDEYQFVDFAAVDGIPHPREVRRTRMRWGPGKDGKTTQFPDWRVVWRVISASAGPIPNSFFALSTARPGAQVEDGRYQVPGKSEPGITYTYSDPSLSIDEASERAYQSALRQQE